jgi:trans-aconitate methyltransferase
MSKYKERGPYHFVEYADKNSIYHSHVNNLVDEIDIHLPEFGITQRLHEVGCGEGLILWQISKRKGDCVYTGNDADELAVEMADFLLPEWITVYHSNNVTKTPERDIVLFADSLEHIETWREHLLWASKAKYVIIAVPSIRDKHAVNVFGLNSFNGQDWNKDMKCVYSKTRHYRHVTIWVKQ